MTTPLKVFFDLNGDPIERKQCSIDGCSRLRQLGRIKRNDGAKYSLQLTTCCCHRKDGQAFPSNNRARRKEIGWKSQGINISYEAYELLLELQDKKCIICGRLEELEGRALSVDHCHKTGKIRGVICRGCNSAIGWLERFTSLGELKDYLEGDIVSRYGDIF